MSVRVYTSTAFCCHFSGELLPAMGVDVETIKPGDGKLTGEQANEKGCPLVFEAQQNSQCFVFCVCLWKGKTCS